MDGFVPKRMKEIRVCWSMAIHQDDDNEIEVTEGGIWFPATERNRKDLALVIAAGNTVDGCGSHWLEEREA